MTLTEPVWLGLAIPLGWCLLRWKAPSRLLMVVRALVLALVLLAMAGLSVVLPARRGTVVVVADRSASMPADGPAQQVQLIQAMQSKMKASDHLAVVGFARRAVVEQQPQHGRFEQFSRTVDADGSDLAGGLELALSLIPPGRPGRVVVLSDGRWTGADPGTQATVAAARHIAIDYRLLARPQAADPAILRLDAPMQVEPGQAFLIHAEIRNPARQALGYQLMRNGQVIASGHLAADRAVVRLTFRDLARAPGNDRYELALEAPPGDPVPENNRARFLVGINGEKALLLVTQTPGAGLAGLLRAARLQPRLARPDQVDWSLAGLANYRAVILENIAADRLGDRAMEQLAAWVNAGGGGLMMTGGRNSYGTGGYFNSPLAPILPVSMELRREHRKFPLAIVIALDRSGSMSMPVGSGKTKMDLANLGTCEAIKMLSPIDQVGVIAVDSSPHVIVPLRQADNIASLVRRVSRIESMGGGIFIGRALEAAIGMVAGAQAANRHIILFADAQDSEEPGNYVQMLEQCNRAGITVSVIGLGTAGDVDADLLKDIAKRGKGNLYFTQDVRRLPRLFAQDTIIMARSAFVEQTTPVKALVPLRTLTGKAYTIDRPIGGYNLCYLKPQAQLAAVSVDTYAAPILAAWQSGLGRVLAYTGEVDGRYTGPIADWPELGELLAGLARWTGGRDNPLPSGMLVRQRLDRGSVRVMLDLDPARKSEPFDTPPQVSLLVAQPGLAARATRHPMQWVDADQLVYPFELHGRQTAMATVDLGRWGTVSLPPLCLPYPAEYQPVDEQRGPASLEQLAAATGGKARTTVDDIWDDLARTPQQVSLAAWLIFLAMALFLLEVLERRSGLLSAFSWKGPWGRQEVRAGSADQQEAQRAALSAFQRILTGRRKSRPAASTPAAGTGEPAGTVQPSRQPDQPAPTRREAESTGESDVQPLLKAMRQARRRADRRAGRREDGD